MVHQLILFITIIMVAVVLDESIMLKTDAFCATNTSSCHPHGIEVKEPFWIDDGSLGEGCTNYPGFRVKCARDGTPVINISHTLYTVLNVTYEGDYFYPFYDPPRPSGYITVKEAAINGQECPQPQQIFPIGPTRFLVRVNAEPVTILYNCSSPPPPTIAIDVQEIPCLKKYYNNGTKHSYAFRNNADDIPAAFDWFRHCEKSAVAYISSYSRTSQNLEQALHQGFQLIWSTPVNCTDCENSGGRCSSNKTTAQISCYCPHYYNQTFIDGICPAKGFCTEKDKRALVYEYMPNGSLERFIYSENNSSTSSLLGPEKLYEITLGIAKGLEYLHRGCNTRILHLDIKPHNILLDHEFCPRISDFGLAKLSPTKESLVSMVGARGTIGYIAPEICCRNFGGVSHKSDVYSYGMMVLEMIGGRKNIDATVENLSEIYFPQWVYTRLELHNKVQGAKDVAGEFFKDEKMKKMIIVALWCIQPHPGDRPSMSKVVEMLEGNGVELQIPPNPFPNPSSTSSTASFPEPSSGSSTTNFPNPSSVSSAPS